MAAARCGVAPCLVDEMSGGSLLRTRHPRHVREGTVHRADLWRGNLLCHGDAALQVVDLGVAVGRVLLLRLHGLDGTLLGVGSAATEGGLASSHDLGEELGSFRCELALLTQGSAVLVEQDC